MASEIAPGIVSELVALEPFPSAIIPTVTISPGSTRRSLCHVVRARIGTRDMSEAASRPGAEGHRFGPDLSCSECGVTWEAHQLDPRKCVDDVMTAPARGAGDTADSGLPADGETECATPEPKEVGLVVSASAGIHARAVATD